MQDSSTLASAALAIVEAALSTVPSNLVLTAADLDERRRELVLTGLLTPLGASLADMLSGFPQMAVNAELAVPLAALACEADVGWCLGNLANDPSLVPWQALCQARARLAEQA